MAKKGTDAVEQSRLTEKTVKPEVLALASTEAEHTMRPLGEPRPMPTDYNISLGAKGGTDQQLLNPGTERRHSMRGFEETYVDIIDYIVRITHRIWEEKDIYTFPKNESPF